MFPSKLAETKTLSSTIESQSSSAANGLSNLGLFKQSFKKHIGEATKTRVMNKVSRAERRLDALARILEQNFICAAVAVDAEDKRLLIATNNIHSGSRRQNKTTELINDFLALLTNTKACIESINEVLAKIIQLNFYQEFRYLATQAEISRPDLEALITELLNSLFEGGDKVIPWRDGFANTELYQEIINRGYTTNFLNKLVDRTARLARDFIKLRSYMHSASYSEADRALKTAISKKRFTIIREGAKKVHAEMRLSSHLAENNKQVPIFSVFGNVYQI